MSILRIYEVGDDGFSDDDWRSISLVSFVQVGDKADEICMYRMAPSDHSSTDEFV